MYERSDALAIVALHVAAVVPGCLHSDAAACDGLGIGRTRKVVDVRGLYHVPVVIQPKVSLLVAGVSCPLVFRSKSLENDVLVPLIVHPRAPSLVKVTIFVQDKKEVVGILTGIHLRVDQILVARPSSFLDAAVGHLI